MADTRGWVRSKVVAGLVGLFAGGLTIMLIESVGHGVFGTADPGDLDAVTVPMFLSVLVAWTAGSGVAGAVATYWSGASSGGLALGMGLILLAGAIANMLVIPHPVWLVVAAVVLMPLSAWMAGRRLVAAGPAGAP
ncbi:MAG: hypothetical protein OEO23_07155 [Gemmatimonadota bacterium]|nr:hypothetical protein [Gemmatimonadota bacterium]